MVFGSTTGTYKFNLLEMPRNLASANVNVLELGSVDIGTLDRLQNRVYTFSGDAGQKLLLNTMTGSSVTGTLYDPNGNVILSQTGLTANQDKGPNYAEAVWVVLLGAQQ